jgi:hypothetical protein
MTFFVKRQLFSQRRTSTAYARVPFRELINNLFSNYDIPSWLPDILILYVVLVMAGYRATVFPLKYRRYLSLYNTKRIDTLFLSDPDTEGSDFNERLAVWAKEYNFESDCFLQGETKDGICEARIKVECPTWQVYAYRTLRCLTLYPVISLEPYRKMSHSPKKLLQLLKSKENDDGFVKEGNTSYTVHGLEFDLAQLHRALQIVALPVLVSFFIFLGTYLP